MLIGYRFISAGDENALLPEEGPASLSSVVKVRRQSGTGRILARSLLARLGKSAAALPRGVSGAPVWPEGFVGSLAHDDEVAVAAVARSETMRSIGIDVEPRMPLPPELVDVVSTRRERMRYTHPILESRVLFCVKEAVFKALHPILGAFLDFHDIGARSWCGDSLVWVSMRWPVFIYRHPQMCCRRLCRSLSAGCGNAANLDGAHHRFLHRRSKSSGLSLTLLNLGRRASSRLSVLSHSRLRRFCACRCVSWRVWLCVIAACG